MTNTSNPSLSGRLDVGDGHVVHWEEHGNPAGQPAVVLHGGPGSGCDTWWTDLFDLKAFRVVLFDQRGCGRSTPSAGTTAEALCHNTTQHLVSDIERLRRHRGVEAWVVLGGSWGSTLALAYAQRHPLRVSAMVLFSVVTTSSAEIEWITRGVGDALPEEWRRFRDAVPPADRDGDLATAYNRLLVDDDPEVSSRAAEAWCRWEQALAGTPDEPGRFADPGFRLGFARLVTHYFAHRAWLGNDQLHNGMTALADVPGTLIHGRRDLGSPVDVPVALAKRWPDSRLVLVEHEGHGAQPGIVQAVKSALNDSARRSRTSPPAD